MHSRKPPSFHILYNNNCGALLFFHTFVILCDFCEKFQVKFKVLCGLYYMYTVVYISDE